MKPLSAADLILATYLQLDSELLNGDSLAYGIVPRWFQQKYPKKRFPENQPVYAGPKNDDILGRIANWLEDPCFDLQEDLFFTEEQNRALAYYQSETEEWVANKRQWDISQNLRQLRTWIYWVSRFSCMDLSDEQVFEFSPSIKDYPKAI